MSLGPLPTADQIVFKALQTYSDGEIVRWIDEAAGAEAEHPAPVLKLTKKADASASASAAAARPPRRRTTATAATAPPSGSHVAGLVLGLAGLVVAVLAFRRAGPRGAA